MRPLCTTLEDIVFDSDQRDHHAFPLVTAEDVGPVESDDAAVETYNPWSVVNVVFEHLADQGLHPVLGERGDPGAPAAALLLALGIQPAAEGNREVMRGVRAHLAELRIAVFEQE